MCVKPRRRDLLAALGPLALSPVASATPLQSVDASPEAPPTRLFGDVMFEKYLAQEVAGLRDQFLGGVTTLAEWKAKRERLQSEFLDMIGLWPLPEKTLLQATVTGSIVREDFVVEKLYYQSRPGVVRNNSGVQDVVSFACTESNDLQALE